MEFAHKTPSPSGFNKSVSSRKSSEPATDSLVHDLVRVV